MSTQLLKRLQINIISKDTSQNLCIAVKPVKRLTANLGMKFVGKNSGASADKFDCKELALSAVASVSLSAGAADSCRGTKGSANADNFDDAPSTSVSDSKQNMQKKNLNRDK